mmetsp:Transcript_51742/g.112494  ORF Transcript_51742/g.112494 Transcript_51742/m.112494 type:complete len:133 (+) Transcript_51742:951-1349(+)
MLLACVVNLVLAVWFRPFLAGRIQGAYVAVLVLLVVLALLALPEMARESLSAPEQFGNNAAGAAALEWLQFVVILTPGCVAVAFLVMSQRGWFRQFWSRLHPNASPAAGGDVELSQINAAAPPADPTALTQA